LGCAPAHLCNIYSLVIVAMEHTLTMSDKPSGAALLEGVVDPEESAVLWVADPNPRGYSFYHKHGFVADERLRSRVECGRYVWSAARRTRGDPVRGLPAGSSLVWLQRCHFSPNELSDDEHPMLAARMRITEGTS